MLTKVFVVLLVVFSIAFTMMTVQFSASIPDWRDQANKFKAEAERVDNFNRNLIALKVAQEARSAAARKSWADQKKQLQAELTRFQTELDDHKARLAKAEADSSSKDSTLKKFTAELGIAQASAEKARGHRQTLEERNIYLETSNMNLTESINERIATIIVLEQQSRQQEQAISILKSENGKLAKQLRSRRTGLEDLLVSVPRDKVRPMAHAGASPIRGHVEQMDGEYASISVGSNDGVDVGMTFIIYNEQGYLADLEITDIEPNGCAGKLKYVSSSIAIGDMAVDERGYLQMN